MNLPNSHFRPPPEREIPAFVRVIKREDVQWNRPVFKAPPLEVAVPAVQELFGLTPVTAHQPGR